MTAVFRDLVLTWKGNEYRVKPTMALLNRIEQDGTSISSVASRMLKQEPPLTLIASIMSHFLSAAGARDAGPEQVYMAMMDDHSLITHASQAIMLAAFPNMGKEAAPTPTPGQPQTPAN
jgi:hypothetical protein